MHDRCLLRGRRYPHRRQKPYPLQVFNPAWRRGAGGRPPPPITVIGAGEVDPAAWPAFVLETLSGIR